MKEKLNNTIQKYEGMVTSFKNAKLSAVKQYFITNELMPIYVQIVVSILSLAIFHEFEMILASVMIAGFFALNLIGKMDRHLRADENMNLDVVSLKNPQKNQYYFFTSMLYGKHIVYMPQWAYTVSGILFIITAFAVLGEHLVFFPFSIYLFNWGRAFFRIKDRLNQAEEVYIETQPGLPDIPSSKKPKTEAIPPIQEAEFTETIVETPPKVKKKRKSSSIDPSYQYYLDLMDGYLEELNEKNQVLDDFLQEIFGNSQISKEKYVSQIRYARDYVEKNNKKAYQAVSLFGKSPVSQDRLDILAKYSQDSLEVVNKVNHIINELILLDQQSILKNGDLLDESLNELAETTHYYSR